MHYEWPSDLDLKMKISLKYIILEMGISLRPLQELYQK